MIKIAPKTTNEDESKPKAVRNKNIEYLTTQSKSGNEVFNQKLEQIRRIRDRNKHVPDSTPSSIAISDFGNINWKTKSEYRKLGIRVIHSPFYRVGHF